MHTLLVQVAGQLQENVILKPPMKLKLFFFYFKSKLLFGNF